MGVGIVGEGPEPSPGLSMVSFASIVSVWWEPAVYIPFVQLCIPLSPFSSSHLRFWEIKITSDVSLEIPTCEDMKLLHRGKKNM